MQAPTVYLYCAGFSDYSGDGDRHDFVPKSYIAQLGNRNLNMFSVVRYEHWEDKTEAPDIKWGRSREGFLEVSFKLRPKGSQEKEKRMFLAKRKAHVLDAEARD